MLAGSAVLFVLVMGLLALSYIRPKWLSRLSAAQWIVGGGLVLPLPILILLTGTALVLVLGKPTLTMSSEIAAFFEPGALSKMAGGLIGGWI